MDVFLSFHMQVVDFDTSTNTWPKGQLNFSQSSLKPE
jgi:hypothetical protein